jgi:arylsulfatase A-like enzyme
MRKNLLLFASAALLAACGGGPKTPNVVLITLDTTRADYLSCYGYPEPITPNMDALAAEGTRFDLAIATASVTPVSHASILSGRFNRDHGVHVILACSGYRLPADVPTLATVLSERGYHNVAVHSAFPVSPHFGLTRGFEVVESFDGMKGGRKHGEQAPMRRSDASVDIVLRELARSDRPFFLWLHLWDPHDWVHLPPQEFLPPPEELAALDADEKARRIYAAEVHYMDAQMGRLFVWLRASGAWQNSIVALTGQRWLLSPY